MPSITMSARKLARLKKRARGVTSVLATATKSLHSRFNLRRIILAADADGHRDAAELVAIHRYVMTETRIGSLPFWMCLDMEKQRHLCKYLKHHFVARAADKPKTLKINPNAPGSALYLTICGEVTRTESGSSKRTSRVMDGSLLGGIFIPDKMRELLVMERQQKLRHEWVAARKGVRPDPEDGYEYSDEENHAWGKKERRLEEKAGRLEDEFMAEVSE